MSEIETKLRSRAVETPDGLMVRLADVEVALVLAKREGFSAGWTNRAVHGDSPLGSTRSRTLEAERAAIVFPLPTRTRQVLREEPVPGSHSGIPYRWNDGHLEVLAGKMAGLEVWQRNPVPSGSAKLMCHALDLHDNPYRTEEVEVDEADPWGERDGPDTTEE